MKYHPLFTLNTDMSDVDAMARAESDIGFIHVARVIDGRPVSTGKQYPQETFPSLDAFVSVFGGGEFELSGRPPDNKAICAKVRIHIDPREHPPLYPNASPALPPVAGGPASSPVLPGVGTGGLLDVLLAKVLGGAPATDNGSGIIAALIASQSQITGLMVQGMQQAATQNMALLSTIGQSAQANQIELVKALSLNNGQANNTPSAVHESFLKGIDAAQSIVQKLQADGKVPDGGGLTMDHIMTIISGFKDSLESGRDILKMVNAPGDAAAASPAAEGISLAPVAPAVHTVAQAS